MTDALPPVDVHAHVATGIHPDRLEVLRAAIFSVTRSMAEWDEARYRNDALCVWGLGSHPANKAGARTFNAGAFRERLADAPFVGEIGLELNSPVASSRQLEIFDEALHELEARPRPASVHSRGRAAEVLAAISARPVPGIILHWWTGDERLTEQAVALGCWFSVNAAAPGSLLNRLPRDRVLTETDYPYVERADAPPARPGDTGSIEGAVAVAWEVDLFGVRRQLWQNLAALYRTTDTPLTMLPREMQLAALTAG